MGHRGRCRLVPPIPRLRRATDTPAYLRALVSGDTTAQQAALDHLWAAVIHQGTPWTVTPMAALVVAGLLADPALSQPVADSISAATCRPPSWFHRIPASAA
jgi:hypothetical protein